MTYSLSFENRFTSLTFDQKIQMSVQHQIIYSHSRDCIRVPWESLTSMMASLALVNGSHHWPVIKWFLPCSTSKHCNHMDRIILCGNKRKTLGTCKVLIAFPRLWWNILYESLHGSTFVCSWMCSDLHLYDIDIHCMSSSYVQIWVFFAWIYVVF